LVTGLELACSGFQLGAITRITRWLVRSNSNSDLYMTDKRIVLSTAGSEEEARKIARALVERNLAACVNILPQITSIYRWQDEVEEAREWLLLVKTTEAAFAQVQQLITELHSYELPECITLAIENGSPGYLQWIGKSISGGEKNKD
jgi:periplasmic divalent cation tolerance protein